MPNTLQDTLDANGARFYFQPISATPFSLSVSGNVRLTVYQLAPASEDFVLLGPADETLEFRWEDEPEGGLLLFVLQGAPGAPVSMVTHTRLR